MAEQEQPGTEAKSGKKRLIIILAGAVLLLVVGAGAAYFLLGQTPTPAAETASTEPVRKEAIYTKIRTLEGKPSFVATLKSTSGRRHFLQAFVEAKSRDQAVADALTLHMPLVVARLNNLFASQSFEELQSIEGKEKLQQASTELVQGILQEKLGKPGIEAILFTNFVMQ